MGDAEGIAEQHGHMIHGRRRQSDTGVTKCQRHTWMTKGTFKKEMCMRSVWEQKGCILVELDHG